MDGAALCARFSIATNRLQYCGPSDAEPTLYAAITRGAELERARASLRRFEALYPYLEAIGTKHGLDPFDEKVVEAYWLGNSLLDAFTREDFLGILDALVRRGLPQATAARLSSHLPTRPIPHHAFHVSFVGVGEVTGHVETTLANIEACRPAILKVLEIGNESLEGERRPLAVVHQRLVPGQPQREVLRYDPRVLSGVKVGDFVAVHWSFPALVLTSAQQTDLDQYAELSFSAANEALPALRVLE